MSEEQGFGEVGEDAIDALYDLGYGAGALVSGEPEVAVDRFLDASSSALDAVTGGGFSHLVERFEEDTGLDTREMVEDGLEYVGEAIGDAAWEATEAVGDAAEWAGEVAEDVWSGVEDAAESVADTAEDVYDSVASGVEDAYDTVTGWFE